MNPVWAVCNWPYFWSQLEPQCESIIKLSCQDTVQGLAHFGMYPYPFADDSPEVIEIGHLETTSGKDRSIAPIGLWLIWYAARLALERCVGDEQESILTLDSLTEASGYYGGSVGMDCLGSRTISPYEEGYAFRFTQSGATEFCTRLEEKHGCPQDAGRA